MAHREAKVTLEEAAARQDAVETMMPTFDAILALATDTLGPKSVAKMLREKAALIEMISTRMMH